MTDAFSRVSSVLYIPIFGKQFYIFLYLEDSPIFLYLEDSPIYSCISGYARNVDVLFKTNVVNFKHGKVLVCNSTTFDVCNQNSHRCNRLEFFDPVRNQPLKVPLTRELLRSAKMAYASYRQRLDRDKDENERQLKQQELAKAEKKRLERERR